MAIVFKPGTKLNSAVCDTQIMVLRVSPDVTQIQCGGVDMSGSPVAEKSDPKPDLSGGTLVGKRYVDAGETLEFLCTKGGAGTLSVNGVALDVKQAKQLPSSD